MKINSIEQLNVLIVEDDRHMRMLIRDMLFALGVKDIAAASDGKAAVEKMQAFRSDLMLVDLKMEPISAGSNSCAGSAPTPRTPTVSFPSS